MPKSRLELQAILEGLIPGRHVYYQPPSTIKMTYPCIVYSKSDERVRHANNKTYLANDRYMITVIDKDPDSSIPDAVRDLPYCTFDRSYTADQLHHFVYSMYY